METHWIIYNYSNCGNIKAVYFDVLILNVIDFHTKYEKTYTLSWICIKMYTSVYESQLFNKQQCIKFYYGFFFLVRNTVPLDFASNFTELSFL